MKTQTSINNAGVEEFFNGDLDIAEGKFREAIKRNAIDSSAYNNLAFILQQKGKLQQAEKAARKSVTINDASSTAWLNLGNILVQQEKGEEGVECLTKAIEISPNNFLAWESLATLSMVQQDYASAEKCWQTAVTIKPDEAKYWTQLGVVKAGLQKSDEAVECMHQSLEINNAEPFTWSQLGIMEFMRKNYGMAEKALMHALVYAPDDENTRYHLALVHLSQNDVHKAAKEFDRILSLNPKNVKVITERGILELAFGNHAAAKGYFSSALKLDPDFSRARQYLEDMQ